MKHSNLEKSQQSSLSGVYRGIDNLTQFINEIQLSQTDLARRLKVIESNDAVFYRTDPLLYQKFDNPGFLGYRLCFITFL